MEEPGPRRAALNRAARPSVIRERPQAQVGYSLARRPYSGVKSSVGLSVSLVTTDVDS
jgi:hypothetical protein